MLDDYYYMKYVLISLFFLVTINNNLFGQCQFTLDSYSHVNCNSENTGSIDISFNDPNISFWWTGPNGFTSNSKNLSSLFAGDYVLTIVSNLIPGDTSSQLLCSNLDIYGNPKDTITIEPEKLPYVIKGDFQHFKLYKYWNNTLIKGYDGDKWYGNLVKIKLCVIDIEILNLTGDEFSLSSSDNPLEIIDSKGYSRTPIWSDIPDKVNYLETIGGFIKPNRKSRGKVAFKPFNKDNPISKIVLQGRVNVDRHKNSTYAGFNITHPMNQNLEFKIINDLSSD